MKREGALDPATRKCEYEAGKGGGGILGFVCLTLNSVSSWSRGDFARNIVFKWDVRNVA